MCHAGHARAGQSCGIAPKRRVRFWSWTPTPGNTLTASTAGAAMVIQAEKCGENRREKIEAKHEFQNKILWYVILNSVLKALNMKSQANKKMRICTYSHHTMQSNMHVQSLTDGFTICKPWLSSVYLSSIERNSLQGKQCLQQFWHSRTRTLHRSLCSLSVVEAFEEKRTGCFRMLLFKVYKHSNYLKMNADNCSFHFVEPIAKNSPKGDRLQQLSDMYESDWIGSILPMGSLSRKGNYFWML